MNTLCITIKPQTAFGSAIKGVTLFGQLCWAVAERSGKDRLAALLGSYDARPFAVVSDAFAHGFVPIPSVPRSMWATVTVENRKDIKKKRWLPVCALGLPVAEWMEKSVSDSQAGYQTAPSVRVHNTINRATSTTGEGAFAPYQAEQTFYGPDALLDVYAVFDPDVFSESELLDAVGAIGAFGYGRDASAGLGKFTIESSRQLPEPVECCCWLTLSDSVLAGSGADGERTCYKARAHFGRLGGTRVLSGNPFKMPVIMAETGAAVTFPDKSARHYVGRAVRGVSPLWTDVATQGYAPVLPLPSVTL